MPAINKLSILLLSLAAGASTAFVQPLGPVVKHVGRKNAMSMELPQFSRKAFMRKMRGVNQAPIEAATKLVSTPLTTPTPATQLSSSLLNDAEGELPESVTKFMTRPLESDTTTVQGASAVIGAVLGFAVGGPLLALVGAALTSYATTAQNDAGEAARGGGKWGIGLYNWFAKINSKYSIVAKTSRAAVSLYNRFKRNVDDKALLDQAEANVGRALEVTSDVSDKYEIPRKVGEALVKTGELSVLAVRGVIDLNAKYKVTSRLLSYIQDQLVRPAQEQRSGPRQSSSNNDNVIVTPVSLKPATA